MVKTKLLRLNIRIKIDGETVYIIRFADDIVMWAEKINNIHREADEINKILKTLEIMMKWN